jgi:outer membrane immunogenic protein
MDTRWLGTLRGRLGVLPAPTVLVYGTGGLAYSEVQATTSLTQSDSSTNPAFSGSGTGDDFAYLVTGWTAGGGVEWMFTQNNWSAKLEYLHYDLGTTSFTWQATDNNIGGVYQNETTSFHNQGNIVRVGLNCLW